VSLKPHLRHARYPPRLVPRLATPLHPSCTRHRVLGHGDGPYKPFESVRQFEGPNLRQSLARRLRQKIQQQRRRLAFANGTPLLSPSKPSLVTLLFQVQCLGRQILEGLLFLRNRYFPPFYHLHAGNVIIQNGVARLAGLENPLLGLLPRAPSAPETLAFGYLLFEMTAGYQLPKPPSPAHLELELERAPKVADALGLIFQSSRTPTLEELVCCELFRGVELRELRGASIIQVRSSPEVIELLEVVRNPVPPSPLRR
jgi:hypothetical protein